METSKRRLSKITAGNSSDFVTTGTNPAFRDVATQRLDPMDAGAGPALVADAARIHRAQRRAAKAPEVPTAPLNPGTSKDPFINLRSTRSGLEPTTIANGNRRSRGR